MIAIVAGLVIQLSQIPKDVLIRLDETTESSFQPNQLTPEQIESYEKEGVVFVPGLISEQESNRLRVSGEYTMNRVFSVSKLFGNSLYSGLGFDLWRTSPDIASFALQSLPKVVASILPYSQNELGEVEFRLLRDAFFQYKAGGTGCGWHVDDPAFWPTEEDSDGPTVWIALDTIKVAEGGGLATFNRTKFKELAPENITESFCRETIKNVGTCNMKTLSPECHAKMEECIMEWDMKPGDAIIWNRWTFHRGVAAVGNISEADFIKRRYSIRYMPYGSKAGPFIHPSVEPGRPFNSPYYPQVWPRLKTSDLQALQHGLEADFTLSRVISRQLPFAFKILWRKVVASITSAS